MKKIQHFIDGELVSSSSSNTFYTTNPATGQVVGEVYQATEKEVEQAVTAARKGWEVWSETPGAERAKVLLKAARLLRERNEELAKLEVLDTGKPYAEAVEVDILSGVEAIEFFAGIAASIHGEHYDLGGSFAYTRRESLGVCAGIGAWNYPIQIACWKSAPALACGNSMVFKPAELTPMTALELAKIYKEAGLPDGVFNVIQGDGEVGKALTEHPDIAKISLTGEVGTGKKVMAASAATLKKVTLELGGKSPILVFPDADLDEAVSGALLGNFYTQGEICSNGTRVYVHKEVKEQFLEKLLARTRKLKIGDPTDATTDVGALISEEHMEKVLKYIELGEQEGARKLCGEGRVQFEQSSPLNGGYFVEPTIFDACTEEMRIVQEEIFGPVMSVLEFEEEKEVIQRANNTPFGLAAGVFTRDLQRAHRVVKRLQAGVCWINTYNITPVEVPFGGYKQSGIGRENGLAAIEHYTQLKTVYVEMNGVDAPY
ncbi:betaine-aldehyde dehydrogenase [Rapidithrix thailandica]|uniref:Betaine-aldehyde dehydrogenase n=1 Tax=Rapidithrix thailandica TaxID=413964 RepID=A0AAW9S6L5_9BACT